MTLSEKFTSGAQFLAFSEYTSGYDFDDVKMVEWFNANPDFVISYTGVMKAITPFIVGKKVTA